MLSLIRQGYAHGNLIVQGLYVGASPFVSAIVVEAGEGDPFANSYVTLQEVRAYVKARNKESLFTDTRQAEANIIAAADFLQGINSFQGLPVWQEQSMLWPRTGVYLNEVLFADDAIPANLKKAQIELAMLIASGVDIRPANNGRFTIQETVGPITVKYSDKIGFGEVDLCYIDSLLLPLIGASGRLRTFRV